MDSGATNGTLVLIMLIGTGAYGLWQGWMRTRHPTKAVLDLPEFMALVLIHFFQGEAAAAKRRAELVSPERLRQTGHYYLVGGGSSIACALILIMLCWAGLAR